MLRETPKITDDEHDVYRFAVGRVDDSDTPRWFHTMSEVVAYQKTLDQVALEAGEYYLTDMAEGDEAEEWATDHVDCYWSMTDEPHHRLARHLASAHGEDEQNILDHAFDIAVEIHEEHHAPNSGPPLVDENDIAEFVAEILSHDADVLTGLVAGYDDAGNEIPSSAKVEALVGCRVVTSSEQGTLHVSIGTAEFRVRIRRES